MRNVILQEFVTLDGLAAVRTTTRCSIVFSSTLDRAPWGRWDDARIVITSAAEEVGRLKQEAGRDRLCFGQDIAT
jgi:hypothetical protein